jgi:hypothetical protein
MIRLVKFPPRCFSCNDRRSIFNLGDIFFLTTIIRTGDLPEFYYSPVLHS